MKLRLRLGLRLGESQARFGLARRLRLGLCRGLGLCGLRKQRLGLGLGLG